MRFDFDNYENHSQQHKIQQKGLLHNGWQLWRREIEWEYLWHLICNDSQELLQKTVDITSDITEVLGRNNYTWWANVLQVFSENTRYDLDDFWNYITPEPPAPDYRYKEVLRIETPVTQVVSRNSIPLEYVLNRVQEITLFKVLEILECPDLITQSYLDRYFYYPIKRFVSWERIDIITTVYAYWTEYEIWLQIDSCGQGRQRYSLMAQELAPFINKATYNLAVILSGYQNRVGKVYSQYSIRTFPMDIQCFTDTVQQEVLNNDQLAVLVSGEPGTGKTAWTQAVAKEILVPLGYVIFILDHDAVENFVPPSYLEKLCIIINEADNLAQDRASVVAQQNNKTERILSLLDGTLYQSVIDEHCIQRQQKLVILMTCNTVERLDPAVLRKGRIDLSYEFTYKFV